jgi:hypothetical protein
VPVYLTVKIDRDWQYYRFFPPKVVNRELLPEIFLKAAKKLPTLRIEICRR